MILKTRHISVYNMVFRNSGEVANKQRVIRVTSLTDDPLKNYLKNWLKLILWFLPALQLLFKPKFYKTEWFSTIYLSKY